MNEKFIKARVPSTLLQALLERAGIEGKRLGTYIREVLERDAQAITTSEALTRIESAITTVRTGSALAQPAMADHALRRELAEVRLIVRELAMQINAQILTRVAAQLATQAPQSFGQEGESRE